jgi:hypothetical protein
MQSPTFIEIWNDEHWYTYWLRNAPARTREYFKFRSVCRMAIWIPFFVGVFYVYVGAVAVFS